MEEERRDGGSVCTDECRTNDGHGANISASKDNETAARDRAHSGPFSVRLPTFTSFVSGDTTGETSFEVAIPIHGVFDVFDPARFTEE